MRSTFACFLPCAAVLMVTAACPGRQPSTITGDDAQPPPRRAFNEAPDRPTGWRHKRSALAAKLGSARHSAVDVIVNPGAPATVRGKFAYGKLSKDLEDEDVWLRVRSNDGAWRPVEKGVTDDDGRVSLIVPPAVIPTVGAYPYEFVVGGDLSLARGVIWVFERGTTAVVFDIDGTLTTGDSELIEDFFGGDIDVRKGAVDVVRHWHQAGNHIVYLTGRPYMYNASTRAWLDQHAFPAGPVATADSLSQAMPTRGGVGAFKRAWLQALVAQAGVDIVAAYGNATTDMCAFAQAGIPPSRTYIIDNDRSACEGFSSVHHLTGDYERHALELSR